jgi:hypothetical protein
MGLESATFISQLNASNPIGASDPKSQGDDHLRLIKLTLQATFPNANGAINPTPAEFNLLAGCTSFTGSTGVLVKQTSPNFLGTTTYNGVEIGVRRAPRSQKSTNYTLVAADSLGVVIEASAGCSSITLPNAVMSAGDFVTIINNSGSAITITQGASASVYWFNGSGTLVGPASRTLASYGVITVYYPTTSSAFVWGLGIS